MKSTWFSSGGPQPPKLMQYVQNSCVSGQWDGGGLILCHSLSDHHGTGMVHIVNLHDPTEAPHIKPIKLSCLNTSTAYEYWQHIQAIQLQLNGGTPNTLVEGDHPGPSNVETSMLTSCSLDNYLVAIVWWSLCSVDAFTTSSTSPP